MVVRLDGPGPGSQLASKQRHQGLQTSVLSVRGCRARSQAQEVTRQDQKLQTTGRAQNSSKEGKEMLQVERFFSLAYIHNE